MLYDAYEVGSDAAAQMRVWGGAFATALKPWSAAAWIAEPVRWWSAAARMATRAGLTHTRPAYGIDAAKFGNRLAPVTETAVLRTPFATLTHFAKDVATRQPRVLVVAPLSGHFGTLLRNTVRTLLADHDVYITDWANARDVPVAAGPFGFDDYVEHVIRFTEAIGLRTHLVAVCQPAVQALAAAGVMAQHINAVQPASVTLMAGPVDVGTNPTRVNELARSRPIAWFEKNLIATVPERHAGAGRRVYPGFLQLAAFMSMNWGRHIAGHQDLYAHLVAGRHSEAEAIETFYDEYFAVLDLAAEFYLETVEKVFQQNVVARNALTYRGSPIDLRAIRRTALMTVEGERDDICSVGQTVAAHDLCTGLRPYMKRHHLQAGVGHYGVFSGRKWEAQTYPLVRNFILAND